jgi:uncharacterized peroxidase-related enzyme
MKEIGMPRITPKPREELTDLEGVFERAEKALGFVPNSFFIMGRVPGILNAFSRLSREVIGVPGKVPLPLKRLIAHVASRSAGCQYCIAHTAEAAASVDGVAPEKIAAAFDYERSPLFSDAERAALSVAQAAGHTPNAVSDADFAALKEHFDEDQIVEIVAVICLFGWLNRFNDTMATELEQRPLAFAETNLAPSGWQVGKHASG